MTRGNFAALCVLLLTAGLIGCGPHHPYKAPTELTAETAATIIGTRIPADFIKEDIRVMVSMIDGKPAPGTRRDWEQPILVAPGSHLIQLLAVQGMLTAEVGTRVALEAGQTYVVHFQEAQPSEPSQIWLEHRDSAAVVGNKIVVLTIGPAPAPVMVLPATGRK